MWKQSAKRPSWAAPPGHEEAAAGKVLAATAPWPFSRLVRAVRFTPDGATLLVGAGSRSPRLFDAATGQETAARWESPAPQAQAMVAAQSGQEINAPAAKPNAEKSNPKPAPPPRELSEHVDIQFNDGLDARPDLHVRSGRRSPDQGGIARLAHYAAGRTQ